MLNGPGTADMKGGIAVILAALKALEASPVADRIGYDVMINSDEETGSHASAGLIRELAAGKIAALTYEPALPDGRWRARGREAGIFRSRSTARPPMPVAIRRMAAMPCWRRRTSHCGWRRPKAPGLSVNPARIDGGGPNNMVPDLAILRVNLRPLTPRDMEIASHAIREAIAAVEREHGVHAHLHGGFNRPAKPLDPGAERLFALVGECGAALGIPIARRDTGGVCDGNNIAACGVPVIDTMGPRGGSIHSSDEFLITDSLAERARLSALTLIRLAERGKL